VHVRYNEGMWWHATRTQCISHFQKKHHKRGRSNHEKKEVSKAHPLSINLTLTLKCVGAFTVSLSFLPYFSAVCASTSSITLEDIPESQHGSFLEKSALLHCLFEGDTGRTSPNSVVSFHIRKHGGDLFSAAVRQHGFPYKWVQRMCGVDLNPEGPDSTALQPLVEVSAKSLEAVVGALKGRFICQVHLTRQIVAMGEFSEMCFCVGVCGGVWVWVWYVYVCMNVLLCYTLVCVNVFGCLVFVYVLVCGMYMSVYVLCVCTVFAQSDSCQLVTTLELSSHFWMH